MKQTKTKAPRARTARHEAKWVDDPGAPPRKKFPWGWLVLLIIPVLIVGYFVAEHNDYWSYADVSVTTLACDEPLRDNPTWDDMTEAGCAPAAIGDQVRIFEGGNALSEPEKDGAEWAFPGLPTAFSTLSIEGMLSESFDRAFLVNADADPPEVGRELSSDASGTHFTGAIGQRGITNYYIVAAPAE